MEVLRFATLPEDRRTFLLQVNDLLGQIDYGAVVIVMHEGKITQIETSEKMRLTDPSRPDVRRRGSDTNTRPRSDDPMRRWRTAVP